VGSSFQLYKLRLPNDFGFFVGSENTKITAGELTNEPVAFGASVDVGITPLEAYPNTGVSGITPQQQKELDVVEKEGRGTAAKAFQLREQTGGMLILGRLGDFKFYNP
jgi:hypothetical protein